MEKINQFNLKSDEIENKYLKYFQSRNSKINTDNHDRLHNHYIIRSDNDSIYFFWHQDSDLDYEIKKELRDAFDLLF